MANNDLLKKYMTQDMMTAQTAPDTKSFLDSILNLNKPNNTPLWDGLLTPTEEGPIVEATIPEKIVKQYKEEATKKEQPVTSTETTAKLPEPSPKKEAGDMEMESALAKQSEDLRAIAIARGLAKMGQAIGGVKPEEKPFATAEELATVPVQQLEKKREAEYKKFTREQEMERTTEARDPNSQYSNSYRNLAKTMLDMQGLENISKAIEGMSAEQIDKRFPIISNIVTAKMAQDARKEQAALLRAGKEDAKVAKEEMRHQDWLTNQFEKEVKSPEAKRIERLASDATNIDRALVSPGGIGEIAVLYGFLKSIDENSAVREGEVKLGLEAMNAMERVKAFSSNFSNKKKVLSPEMIKDIKTINDAAKAAAADAYNRRMQKVYNQGIDRGIPKERLDRSLGLYVQESGFMGTAPSQAEMKQDSKVSDFAKANKLSYDQAKQLLMKRGYTPNEQ